jgi:hypothetical protein
MAGMTRRRTGEKETGTRNTRTTHTQVSVGKMIEAGSAPHQHSPCPRCPVLLCPALPPSAACACTAHRALSGPRGRARRRRGGRCRRAEAFLFPPLLPPLPPVAGRPARGAPCPLAFPPPRGTHAAQRSATSGDSAGLINSKYKTQTYMIS